MIGGEHMKTRRLGKTGLMVSEIGFGGEWLERHTETEGIELIRYASEKGINMLDCWMADPKSRNIIGEGIKENRDQWFIQGHIGSTWKDNQYFRTRDMKYVRPAFEDLLKRLQTDYIDYYLMHMLTDIPTWEKLKKLGMEEWIREKKASGQIRQIGFSYHGNSAMFCQLVDAYDWDFCQIQYNYMDEHSQAGVEGLRYANKKGLPVIIMEPLRGGRLVNLLPEPAKELFRKDEQHRTPAELALKWLYNQPEVTCVLSGMNSMEMVEQNVKTASESLVGCLTESDQELIEKVKAEIKKNVKVGCTGCGYCMPCPRGVDIPGTFRCYNAMYSEGKKSGRRDYLQCTAFRKDTSSASQCISCGKCETHCPQHIEIRKELKNAAAELEDVKYKVMKTGIQLLKLW